MKTVRVRDAEGIVLDWMVAATLEVDRYYLRPQIFLKYRTNFLNYTSSQGLSGALIDRIGLSTLWCGEGKWVAFQGRWGTSFCSSCEMQPSFVRGEDEAVYGPTRMIAVARAYVFAVHGEHCDVPDEIAEAT